jgi:hypothetical protein
MDVSVLLPLVINNFSHYFFAFRSLQLIAPDTRSPKTILVKGKVKFALEQAMKGQRGNRGIALLFL